MAFPWLPEVPKNKRSANERRERREDASTEMTRVAPRVLDGEEAGGSVFDEILREDPSRFREMSSKVW